MPCLLHARRRRLAFGLAALLVPVPALADEGALRSELFRFAAAAARELAGSSLAVAGHRLAVGVPGDDAAGSSSGRVDVYCREVGGWRIETTLRPSVLHRGDAFGSCVEFDGARLLVGAPGSDLGVRDAGAAFLFEWDGVAWSELAVLQLDSPRYGDRFGSSVALDGDRMAGGAPRRDAGAPDTGVVLVATDAEGAGFASVELTVPGAMAFEGWGGSLALDGDTLLVGAPWSNRAVTAGGAVARFESSTDGWQHRRSWTSPSATFDGGFGYRLALDATRLAVGAVFEGGAAHDTGVVHLFDRVDGRAVGRLWLSGGRPGDAFGASIADFDGGWLVGAPHRGVGGEVVSMTGGADGGSVRHRLLRTDAEAGDRLGASLAVHDDVVLTGAPGADLAGAASGLVLGFAIHRLSIAAPTGPLASGDSLELAVAPAAPGTMVALAAVEWDGAGMFRIFALRRTPEGRRVSLAASIPPALHGHELGVQAFGWTETGLESSEVARLLFR